MPIVSPQPHFIAKPKLGMAFYGMFPLIGILLLLGCGFMYLAFYKPYENIGAVWFLIGASAVFLFLTREVGKILYQGFRTIEITNQRVTISTWYGSVAREIRLTEILSWYEIITYHEGQQMHRLIIETPNKDWIVVASAYENYAELKKILTAGKKHNHRQKQQTNYKHYRSLLIIYGVCSIVMWAIAIAAISKGVEEIEGGWLSIILGIAFTLGITAKAITQWFEVKKHRK